MNFELLLVACVGVLVGWLGQQIWHRHRVAPTVPTPPAELRLGINPLVVEVFQDKKNDWRWHAKRGGRVVAESGEGYKDVDTLCRTLENLIIAFDTKNYRLGSAVIGHGFMWGDNRTVLHFKVIETTVPAN